MKNTVNQLNPTHPLFNDQIILVNKPLHWTSADVLNWIKKACHISKCGHAGTLDPLATGLLVVGIYGGTKKLNDLLLDTKQYVAKIAFGYETESGDNSSEIINYDGHAINPSLEAIIQGLDTFKNQPYFQAAPKYSALKYNGKPLYYWARQGIETPVKVREVQLIDYQIISYAHNLLEVQVTVSKGFYVRSLAIDLGHYLNGYATLVGLERTQLGNYSLNDAYSLDDLYQLFHPDKGN